VAAPIGLILGYGLVLLVHSLLSPQAYATWGWRLFFIVGFLVALVGIAIRSRTEDSALFEAYRAREGTLKLPASQVWKEMPGRILRTSIVNAMFGGTFWLFCLWNHLYASGRLQRPTG
jgi:MFS family permease